MHSLQDPVSQLMALFAAGRFAEMEQQARSYLAQAPDAAILRELLGISLVAQSQHEKALPLLKQASRRAPNEPQFWENLGLCQRHLEKYADAESSLRKALSLRPKSAETLNALGSVLRSLERFEEAETAFREALVAAPDHAGALFNLGTTLRKLYSPEMAERHLRNALKLQPYSFALHHELGLALGDQGRHEQAIESIRRSIALNPNEPGTRARLAMALSAAEQHGLAAEAALQFLDMFGDPKTKISDSNIAILDAIADILTECGRNDVALRLQEAIYRFDPRPPRALGAMLMARHACDWKFATELETAVRAATRLPLERMRIDAAFTLLMLPSATPQDQFEIARRVAQRAQSEVVALDRPPPAARSGGRLRIGYVSADLREHPVGMLIAGVIEAHDRAQFEVVAYDAARMPGDNIHRQRLTAAFDRIVPVAGLRDRETAQRIADDAPDVVVDLAGWTSGTRISALAFRPAPTQMQWLGFPGTTGAQWIDYIIADRILIPPGEEAHYSEKVVRLPNTFQPNDRKREIAPTKDRGHYGLPERGIVFCSFNQAFKLTPEVFGAWMKLLKNVEGSVLWLSEPSPEVRSALDAHAAAHGIATGRLIYAPRVPSNAEHLARIGLADLALDCFPYGAHTTATDTIWAGVPIIALKGVTLASRVSASVLQAAGLPELICHDLDQYFELAVHLASDRDALAALKSRIKDKRDAMPLFDTERFTRNLEAAYREVVERHRKGLAPDHLDIRDAGANAPTTR